MDADRATGCTCYDETNRKYPLHTGGLTQARREADAERELLAAASDAYMLLSIGPMGTPQAFLAVRLQAAVARYRAAKVASKVEP